MEATRREALEVLREPFEDRIRQRPVREGEREIKGHLTFVLPVSVLGSVTEQVRKDLTRVVEEPARR